MIDEFLARPSDHPCRGSVAIVEQTEFATCKRCRRQIRCGEGEVEVEGLAVSEVDLLSYNSAVPPVVELKGYCSG
jgi:hypothetical protein